MTTAPLPASRPRIDDRSEDIETLRQNAQGPGFTGGSLRDQELLDSPLTAAVEREEAALRRTQALEEQERLDHVWLGIIDSLLENNDDPRRITVAWRHGWTVLLDGEVIWEL